MKIGAFLLVFFIFFFTSLCNFKHCLWRNVFVLPVVGFDEFQNLLTKQAPIEGYTEWLDNIIDKCVLQVNDNM